MGSMRFTADAGSARAARTFVRETLSSMGRSDLEAVASLLTSELVTNVVRHSGSGGAIDVEVSDRVVRVSVSDDSPILPALRDPGAPEEGGRGLWLVERLADDWGTRRVVDDGKVVWFETGARMESR